MPLALLIDPISTCNLHCKGCWAADYQKSDNLDLETLDRIITEAKDMGIYIFLFSGGEPLMRKTDLLKLAKKHKDAVFATFTNATLIDDAFAAFLHSLGNFIPIISIEGTREQTDERRGNGTYDACMRAMEHLHSHKVPFGFSSCYHRHNTEYVDGCIAGGRKYLHINARGDVEPCAFIHYATNNIHDISLLEALKNDPLFLEYKKHQPFNKNMLQSCPMFDNPEFLKKMVQETGAHSTHLPEPETVEDLYARCKPAADAWAPVAKELWQVRDK